MRRRRDKVRFHEGMHVLSLQKFGDADPNEIGVLVIGHRRMVERDAVDLVGEDDIVRGRSLGSEAAFSVKMLVDAEKVHARDVEGCPDLGPADAHERVVDGFVLQDAASGNEIVAFGRLEVAPPQEDSSQRIADDEIDRDQWGQADNISELMVGKELMQWWLVHKRAL